MRTYILAGQFTASSRRVPVLLRRVVSAVSRFANSNTFSGAPICRTILRRSPGTRIIVPPDDGTIRGAGTTPVEGEGVRRVGSRNEVA